MSELQADLQLRYPGFVLDVSLRLPGQGVSVLIGPSGSGKTTVLRSLAGLERAKGRIAFNGEVWQDDEAAKRVHLPTHRRAIGYVFQEASLFPHLSVKGNLEYGQRRVPSSQQRIQLGEAADMLGIAHLMHRQPDGLSGGERQRVAIARALLTSPSLLLMDEPLSALDAARKAEILPYLERLNQQARVPMVYVTHALDEAARLADYMVLMDAGKVQASGLATDVLARLDLPLSHLDDAAAVIEGIVDLHDPAYGQSRLNVGGLPLWVGLSDVPLGQRVRVKVLARDVSVALSQAQDTSIVNILPAVILQCREDGPHTSTLSLQLHADGEKRGGIILARLTRRSCDALGLHVGQKVVAQIKGAALMG